MQTANFLDINMFLSNQMLCEYMSYTVVTFLQLVKITFKFAWLFCYFRVYCRYNLTKRLIEERQFKAAIQQRILQEGVTNVPQETVIVKLEDA